MPNKVVISGFLAMDNEPPRERVLIGTLAWLAVAWFKGVSTLSDAFGPQGIQIGSRSINASTPVQIWCLAVGSFTFMAESTIAAAPMMRAALTEHSKNRCTIISLSNGDSARISQARRYLPYSISWFPPFR